MSARSSPPKMKMWDQEELLRGWVEQRNHKSDFGETNPILPQAQETKTHLSAMTVYFCSAGLCVFRQTRGFSNSNPADRSRFGFPTSAFNTYEFGKTKPIFPQAQETKTHLSAMTIYFRKKPMCALTARNTRG